MKIGSIYIIKNYIYDLSNTSIYRLAKKYNLNEIRSKKKQKESKELSENIYKDYKNGIKKSDINLSKRRNTPSSTAGRVGM